MINLIASAPIISEGIKSGVNCILLKSKSKTSEIVLIIKTVKEFKEIEVYLNDKIFPIN